MNRRDWWLVGAGMNVMGAFVGALIHSAFIVTWNMVWLGIAVCVLQNIEEK